MPSFFKKIFHPSYPGKANPYSRPDHPSNSKNKSAQITVNPSTGSNPQPQPPSQRSSPRGSIDYLAEARQASGRNPITGKIVPQQPQAWRQREVDASRVGGDDVSRGPSGIVVGVERREGGEPPSTQNAQRGTRYDAFVQEMSDRKRGAWKEPEGGYYAPERRVGEFYQPAAL